jgi:hypothetical protein
MARTGDFARAESTIARGLKSFLEVGFRFVHPSRKCERICVQPFNLLRDGLVT